MIPLRMPTDIVEGTECMECEVPWMVPEAIEKMNEVIHGADRVLEIGAGASTLFFGRRCQAVVSMETNRSWFNEVEILVKEKGLPVSMALESDENQICERIKSCYSYFSIFSVDTQGGDYNRSKILNAFLQNKNLVLRMIVLDNYGHEGLFPDHWNKIIDLGPDWEVFTYDHPRWAGNGTRLYIKKEKPDVV